MNHPTTMDHTAVHDEPDYGTGHKTFGIYLFGFIACIVLTLIPFAAVMYHPFSHGHTFLIMIVSAIFQFFVQVICFLRLNTKSEQGLINVLSFMFSIVVLLVLIGGSLWIMYHLNYNMMH